mmetsp:Transcript_20327/g.17596  ORF Transcript_20327/g.17596 Transcript_20327/m.17596 type:complete len:238 (+) Transcript_20327:74-787(+)
MASTKDYNTPPRRKVSDASSPKDDAPMLTGDSPHGYLHHTPMQNKKRGAPLQLSSVKFSAKNMSTPPFVYDSVNNAYETTDVTHSSVNTEPVHGPGKSTMIEHLDLNNFKTKACPISSQHNHKHCPYYHNNRDRKRPKVFYSAEMCEYAEKDPANCPHGDECLKSHNRVEQLYRTEKYKTKFCTCYPHHLDKCEYGHFCSFAHSENDILIELIHNYEFDDDFYSFHYKTVWCPFNLT